MIFNNLRNFEIEEHLQKKLSKTTANIIFNIKILNQKLLELKVAEFFKNQHTKIK